MINTQNQLNIIQSLKDALGNELINYLTNHLVDEIVLNPDGKLFIYFSNSKIEVIENFEITKAEYIIRNIASLNDLELTTSHSSLGCELTFLNARFTAVIPPLCKAPSFCIRSLHSMNLTLDVLVKQNFLTYQSASIIEKFLISKKNILVCGQTGSGKTSFLNTLLNHINKLEPLSRIVSIEDTPELQINAVNKLNLFTSNSCSMSDLVKLTLRLSPNRIVVGEIRSFEALDMVDAFSTGHSGGLASMHAGSVEQCLERLKLLISKNKNAPANIDQLIALAIDVVIVIKREPRRHVEQIALIKNYFNNKFHIEYL